MVLLFFCARPKLVLYYLLNLQFLFNKYMKYEESLGDDGRVDYVRQKAMDYVETTME